MNKELELINNKNRKHITKKLKKFLNKVVNSIGFIIILGILVLAKTIFFYKNTIALSEPLSLMTIIGSASFIAVVVCFLCVLPNRLRAILGIIINFLISILLFSDNCYYTYSNSVLSVAQITNIQYGEEIISTLPMLIELKHILYFLDIIIIFTLLLTKIIKINKKEKKTKKALIAKWLIGITGVIIFLHNRSKICRKR